LQLLVEAKRGVLNSDVNAKELTKEEEEALLKPTQGANKSNIKWTDSLAISQAMVFLIAG
jgi:hypothetical protein